MNRTELIPTVSRSRVLIDKIMSVLIVVAVVIAVGALLVILADTLIKGLPVMSLKFLTNRPYPTGIPGGGIGPDLEGTFIMVGLATLISVPVGVGAGVYFSEWPESRISLISSFTNDVLAEFPSMVIGVFIYIIIVLTMKGFSGFAGAVALAIIMIPIVARTTEESLKIVPRTLREASIALGVSRWRTVLRIVISTGRAGLVTGILLALARAAGESAPLLVTSLGNSFFAKSLFGPVGAVPLLIYEYGISPYKDWQADAWGAALVLVGIMLALNLSIKLGIRRGPRGLSSETRAEI
jgi:phosphate transport system permease protein